MELPIKILVMQDAMKQELLMKALAQQPDFLADVLKSLKLYMISKEMLIKMHVLQIVEERLP